MTVHSGARTACSRCGRPRRGSTRRLTKEYGVRVGAHPGWADLQGFGRREMTFSTDEAEALVLYQIGALAGVAEAEGVRLVHVKPHGAMYNQAATDRQLAAAIARAVRAVDAELILVGLAGSVLVEAGLEAGLRVANEGFPDRRYNADGSLLSRKQGNALVEAPEEIAAHAVALASEGIDLAGQRVRIETLGLHGDHPRAAENAKRVREALTNGGIEVTALAP